MNRICKGIPEFTKEARFPGKGLNFVLNYKNSNKNIAVPNPDCPKNPDFENDKDLKNKPYFTLADLNACSDEGDRFSGKLELKYLNEVFKCGAGMLPGKFPVCEADTEKEEFKSCMAKLNEKYIRKPADQVTAADKQNAIMRGIMDKMTGYVKNMPDLFVRDYDKLPKSFGEYIDKENDQTFKNCGFSKMMQEIKESETSKSGELPQESDLAMSRDGLESEVTLTERTEILDKYVNNGQNPQQNPHIRLC